MRRAEFAAYGEGINLAARLMVKAPWGEIWLDERVARRASRQFRVELEGEFSFKGFPDPLPVYALLERGQSEREPFFQGAMVGREAELVQLAEFIQPALADRPRFAGLMVIQGEAGMGKSRLVYEVQRPAGVAASRLQWLCCQANQTVRQPLNPFRYWLRNYFGQSPVQSATRNKRAFSRKLDQLISATADEGISRELNRLRSCLGSLVDLFPRKKTRRRKKDKS